MTERARELFNNRDFLERVLVMEPADAAAEFRKNGADISEQELLVIADDINAYLASGGELTENALYAVCGGKKSDLFWFAVGVGVGIGIVCAPW